ncbi:class I adenylate-forming enzyme family protein [Rhodococcus sp. USK13]|uniref:class I adenylate-forming enzyme family protein n=1 Tax=Rhodococcus sp. USK13 TaxID=2806442 RepID=UPI001BCCC442|nr:class I adenylate-forming enzyme family protein [Rhodococcus sp. USK13]
MTEIPDYASLPERAAQTWPDRIALRFQGESWTYSDFADSVTRAEISLRRVGVGVGTRTALLVENRPEYVIAQFALARIGAVFVTPNPYWTDHEIRAALDGAHVTAAVYSQRHRTVAAESAIRLPVEDLVSPVEERTPPEPAERIRSGEHRDLFIPFSSGTTGHPKGVIHTHAGLSGGVHQLVTHLGLGATDVLQISLPLCHVFGTSMMGAALAVGAQVTLFERFDLDACLRHIRDDAVTVWPLAGTVAHQLLDIPHLGSADFPGLRYFMWGGSAAPAEVAKALTLRTGVGFLCSYGMTEAMTVAFNPVHDPADWRLDSPGYATEGTEIRLGPDDEIEVRGVSVARGYTTRTTDAAAAFTADGWFRTGDVGRIEPSGRIRIVDRRKDMIKVSGFQVAPTEVEQELLRHPVVDDVAVVGRPDDRHGERVVAYVVASSDISVDDLRRFLGGRLATYKIPREFSFVEVLPRTASGKLQRSRLRTDGPR